MESVCCMDLGHSSGIKGPHSHLFLQGETLEKKKHCPVRLYSTFCKIRSNPRTLGQLYHKLNKGVWLWHSSQSSVRCDDVAFKNPSEVPSCNAVHLDTKQELLTAEEGVGAGSSGAG